jgi:hypothetical protein
VSGRRPGSAGLAIVVALALAMVGGGAYVAGRVGDGPALPLADPAPTTPGRPAGPTSQGPTATGDAAPSSGGAATPTYGANAPQAYPSTGPGTYEFAVGQSPVFGSSGPLRRFRVAVETGSPVPVDAFATVVEATLNDPRSWIAGGAVRLRRVPGHSRHHFTIYLVPPGTAYRLCRSGGLDIYWRGQPYTSCRVGGTVVINLARYLAGVPGYGAPLETYRQYAINHEVGHALGHGHELCPGRGRPAPVMQQQTFGLRGCVAYSWPYRAGRRYAGPSGDIRGG